MTTTSQSESAAKKDVTKLQRAIVDGLEDVKAQDIQVFNTEHLSPLFERVIVASPSRDGFGNPRLTFVLEDPPFGGPVAGIAAAVSALPGEAVEVLLLAGDLAAPDAVVAFYRQRAEAAGLAPVMAMNQGEARAYGAAARTANGATMQVVASPGEGGLTSVQLTWSAGA